MDISEALIKKITEYDAKGTGNEYRETIERRVRGAVNSGTPLRFLSFTCSTIRSEYLFSETPWLYINTDPVGNNLEPDIAKFQEVMRGLRDIYPLTELVVIIGNTDPYYIYLRQFKDFSEAERTRLWKQFSGRWSQYKDAFSQWLTKSGPDLNARVLSWYEFEKAAENNGRSFEKEYEQVMGSIGSYANQEQLDWEFRKLQTQFGKGMYFERLEKPSDELLRDWVVRKFAEYAVQAQWLYERIPGAILIQNEKPSDLRSQMYQSLVKEKNDDVLPIVYFLGVDNTGYQ